MSPLPQATIEAMTEALEDEYKARALYQAVIDKFGPVRPFINIVEAENRHANALIRQFNAYGVPVPTDEWPSQVSAPDTVAQACADAVEAEIENADMYERLLAAVSEPTIRQVFTRLRDASQDRHLPAFRRCASRYGVRI